MHRPAPAAPRGSGAAHRRGRFTNDLNVPGALHLAVVRSPYAHARITAIDTSAARGAAGVVAVYTGADLADAVGGADAVRLAGHRRHEEPGPLPAGAATRCATSATASWPSLATSEAAARDAVEAVDVDVRAAGGRHRPRGRAVRPGRHPRRPRHQHELHVGAQGRGHRGRRRRGVRRRRLHGQRALRPAAPAPDGDGAARRRRRAAAVRRRHHALLGDPDPAHPQGDDGDHARHPRAPGARRRPGRRRRLRLEAQRVRRGAAVHGARPASTACPCAGTRRAPRTPRPRSTAAARSSTSTSPPTPTASSPALRVRLARRHGRLPPARHAGHPAARRVPVRRRLRPARRRTTSSARRCSRR